MFLPCTSIWRPVKLNTSWKNCFLLIILTLSSNRGWEGEGCVEKGFCLQLRDGDGDAEASRHIRVQVGLRCSSKSSTSACSCLHLHTWPTTDALRSSLPAGHEAVGGEGEPGRDEEDEEGGEGDGDHPVQGVNVQWPGLATSKLILPDSSLCDPASKNGDEALNGFAWQGERCGFSWNEVFSSWSNASPRAVWSIDDTFFCEPAIMYANKSGKWQAWSGWEFALNYPFEIILLLTQRDGKLF